MSRAKRWVFTLNNPTAEEEQSLVDAANNPRHVEYLVWGRERGSEGDTPHFQGFVIFKAAVRFTTVKNRLGSARYHLEVAKGTDQQASDYCKKDGDYEEYGELPPVTQGTRTDLQSFFDWCTEEGNRLGRPVTTPEAARAHPTIVTKFRNAMAVQRLRFEREPIINGQPRDDWQSELNAELLGDADDRKIRFIIDYEGGKGKSWFVRYYLSHNADAQFLSIGKRDDISHAVKEQTRVFLFDIPRGSMEYLQYGALEMIKNRLVFSPKYSSTMKILNFQPHVVVFANEDPDPTALTEDRYDITLI